MDTKKPQLPAGVLIDGRYVILKPLGHGGMAHVYLAEDRETGGQVAVKVMKDDLTDDPEFIKRFDTEARSASSLDHPNIVKILGYGQDQDLRYIVQEYVEGNTLKELIQQRGSLDWQLAVPLAIQIGLALEHAHKRGVVHRDIKPQNILITSDLIAKVTDFGIARATNANTITLTSGVAFGSVHYFSPEQARGGIVSEKSDIYSLGILLFEMLTGKLPFDGETSVAVAIKHLQELPPPPSSYQAELPPALDQIVLKCIQKSPESRYQDARELVDELDAFMIEPNGIYGVISGNTDWEGSTTAIGLQRAESNFGKIREIEKSIQERRRSRYRDTAIV
ncbi:MAG: protein kinase, partial [Eubacteriales bacterium]|nr:protein kinase [Eubacteriales bacterium]MDD4681665.1 protein kinase [Eubacteriales bacterium]